MAGKPSGGGTRPFGYESDHRTARPAEAAVIRECAARALAGDSLRSICIDLNDRQVETVQGCAVESADVAADADVGPDQRSARAPRRDRRAAEWEAIISPVETQRLRAKLGDPDRRTNRSARRYLLGPAVRCGLAGCRCTRGPALTGRRRYVCASGPSGGCGKITIVADPLELVHVEAVLHRLDSPELAAALNGRPDDPEGAGWQAEIEQAQEQLDELAGMWANQRDQPPRVPDRPRHDQKRQEIGPETTRGAQPHVVAGPIMSGTLPGCGSGGRG